MAEMGVITEPIIEYFQTIIAGKKFEIECKYYSLFLSSRDYLSKFETPDFVIPITTQEEIDRERIFAEAANETESGSIFNCSDGLLESMVVCRKVADAVLEHGFLLFHGAAIAARDRCFVFMAKSGTGKTTHIEKWLENYTDSFVVNGDKPFIDTKNLMVFGSPWNGKERYGRNTAVRLGGLIWLERGAKNEIERIPFARMIPCLFRQCHIPNDSAGTVKVMRLLDGLKNVPCWNLKCNMDDDAGAVSYNALVGNETGDAHF